MTQSLSFAFARACIHVNAYVNEVDLTNLQVTDFVDSCYIIDFVSSSKFECVGIIDEIN